MRIDPIKCITDTFDDPGWVGKVLVGSLLALLSILFLPIFILSGYFIRTTRQSAEGDERTLPGWDDLFGLFVEGFGYSVALFIWTVIPTGLIVVGGWSFIVSLIVSLTGESWGLAAGALGGGMALACLVAGAVLLFLVAILLPALTIRYAMTRSFGSMFQVGGAISDILAAPIDYLVVLVAPTVLGIIGNSVVGFLATITFGIGAVLSLPVTVIVALVVAKMQGSYFRNCLV